MTSDGDFKKKEHVLKTKDFGRIYKSGRCHKKDGIVLYSRANDMTFGRIGFSISARKVRLASTRNRIRRVFREIYRKNKNALKPGMDIVIVVRNGPGKKFLYKDAEVAFFKLAKESGILK